MKKTLQTSKPFDDKADLYAASRPTYPKTLFDFIDSLLVCKNEVWDCAVGNGQASVGQAKKFSSVEAADISKEQISRAFAVTNINYTVQNRHSTGLTTPNFGTKCHAYLNPMEYLLTVVKFGSGYVTAAFEMTLV